MNFRQAKAEDFEAVSALSNKLAYFHVEGRPDICKSAPKLTKREFKKQLKKESFYYTLAEDGGKIAGLCKWRMGYCRKNEHLTDRTFAVIYELIIIDEYRRNGYATQLFGKVTEMAKEKGAAAIELYVWEFNENARKFYQSLGMAPQRILLEKKI